MSNITDFLSASPPGWQVGKYVRMTNRQTALQYYSTGPSDSTGSYTINNIPTGIYDVAWNLTGNPGDAWIGIPGTYEVSPNVSSGAVDALVVHLAGTETITGAKTFSGIQTFTNQLRESSTASVVPFSGGGQASATALTSMFNRVTSSVATVAPYDSVQLPASAVGLDVVVVNATNNPIQVFGNGTDTINGVASATGITQPANSVETYFCTAAGLWNVDPGIGYSGQFFTELTNSTVVPFSGGGQASATLLAAEINRVNSSVATVAPFDSIRLPASAPGLDIVVVNSSANPIQVFGTGTDTINGQAAATGVTQAPSSVETYFCPIVGNWFYEAGAGFSGQLMTELAQDNIVAFAGGGQASATQLWAQTNRINTVATAGDSVKLPVSTPGLELLIINHGVNSMQVYGLGTDTIDDVAAATGVSQMTNSMVMYTCATAGKWYTNGIGTGFSGQFPTVSFLNGITAFATGGQASATLLTNVINRVTTVTTIGDSVKLPVSAGGMQITVANAAVNSLNLFPNTGDSINGAAINTAFAIPGGKTATFYCAVPGQWHAVLSA